MLQLCIIAVKSDVKLTVVEISSFLHFFVFLISLTGVRCFNKQLFVTPLVNQREEKKENKRCGRHAYKVSYSLKLLKLGPVCTTTNSLRSRRLEVEGTRKKREQRRRHARGEVAPARKAPENRFPPPLQLLGSRCVICQKV